MEVLSFVWTLTGVGLTIADLYDKTIKLIGSSPPSVQTQDAFENYVVVGSNDGLLAFFVYGNWTVRDSIRIFYDSPRDPANFVEELSRICAYNHIASKVTMEHKSSVHHTVQTEVRMGQDSPFMTPVNVYRNEFHYVVNY